nr:hypothetical protein [Klebsiella oxytoca]
MARALNIEFRESDKLKQEAIEKTGRTDRPAFGPCV